jgi:Reverse transcriptase (RNA-dependent DNA polymerase)/gag-polypeptide of LTR copia-type/Integrase core domain/GAG-pre-integrase domain/Zinc knuckle
MGKKKTPKKRAMEELTQQPIEEPGVEPEAEPEGPQFDERTMEDAAAMNMSLEAYLRYLEFLRTESENPGETSGRNVGKDNDPDSSDSSDSDHDDFDLPVKPKIKKKILYDSDVDESDDDDDFKVISKVVVFNGTNYPIWKRYIQGTFAPKKLWKIVIGKEVKPDSKTDPDGAKRWKKKNMAAMTAMIQSCHSSVHEHFLTHHTAYDCWTALQNLYEKGYSSKVSFIFKEFISFRMKGTECIDDAVKRFNVLIEQLNSLGKYPPEDEKIFVFLNGLPSRFDVSVEVINAREDPSLSYAINHLKQSERLKDKERTTGTNLISQSDTTEIYNFSQRGRGNFRNRGTMRGTSRGNFSRNANPSNQTQNSQIICYKCQQPGHISAECPDRQRQCDICHKYGHTSNQCYSRTDGASHMIRGRGGRGGTRGRASFRGRGRGRGQGRGSANTNSDDDVIRAFHTIFDGDTESDSDQILSTTLESDPIEVVDHENSKDWIIDSGATHHLCTDLHLFTDVRKLTVPRSITVANGQTVPIDTIGTVKLNTPTYDYYGKETVNRIRLNNTLYYAGGIINLMSVPQVQRNGGRVNCLPGGRIVLCDKFGSRFGEGYVSDSLQSKLVWNRPSHTETATVNFSSYDRGDLSLWHHRLCHTSESNIKEMIKNTAVRGLECTSGEKIIGCSGCNKGKQLRKPHPKKDVNFRATEPLELVHVDLCGDIKPLSMGGCKYIFVIVDDFSRKSWVYLLKRKSEAIEKFKEFVIMAERQCDRKLKTVRSDQGGEFVKFDDYCKQTGIRQQFTAAYSPESNGIAERKNRTLQEMVRCMMHSTELPMYLWGDAISSANYITNRRLTSVSGSKTPQELWSGKKPNIRHLRIWGCRASVYIEKRYRKGKFSERSWEGYFIGYSQNSNQYRIYNPSTKSVIESRNVEFNEDLEAVIKKSSESKFDLDFEEQNGREEFNVGYGEDENGEIEEEDDEEEEAPIKTERRKGGKKVSFDTESKKSLKSQNSHDATTISGNSENELPQNLRRSSRINKGKGPNNFTYEGLGKPSANFISQNNENDFLFCHMNGVTMNGDPNGYKEALNSGHWESKWKGAYDKELKSIIDNKTFEVCKLPEGKKAIDSKWVFKTKTGANGEVLKYKARLVAKGFQQTEGVDYSETYAPVVKFDSLRILIAIATAKGKRIQQMDVETAFLNGEIREELYMKVPEGVPHQPGEVWRLLRALYGLKQASRAWYEKLHTILIGYGFIRSKVDSAIYVKGRGENQILFSTYVDDFITVCDLITDFHNLREHLRKFVRITDMGEVRYILGIEVIRKLNGDLKLSQKQYTKEVLKKFGMERSKPLNTPLDPKDKLQKFAESESVDVPYREAIGSLMYLSVATRPDISAAVCVLSKYSSDPKAAHWEAVKRVFRYLQATIEVGLEFKFNGELECYGYCDANYGGDEDTGRSTSGYAFVLGGAAIAWSSRLQPTVALSSTESEYMAACHAAKETVWLKELLSEMGYEISSIVLYCDSMSCIALAKNPIFHKRTKHIRIQWHFVRDLVEQAEIEFVYVPTKLQAADMLTKSAVKEVYETGRSLLGLH